MMRYIIILIIISGSLNAAALNDSLVFRNGDVIAGEIKSMDRGVVVVETDYSDSDFKIVWNNMFEIYTVTSFFITLSDGSKYYGTLQSILPSRVNILTVDFRVVACDMIDIVQLTPIKKNFLDRIDASIDVGFSLTKANNLRQFSTNSSISYIAPKWSTDASFNSLYSQQDSVAQTQRSDAAINYRYILKRRWYTMITLSALSNTEQKLDLRMNAQLGMGRFLLRTNEAYWGAKLGLNRNMEKYSSETGGRSSWEGYLGNELNLYDIGDLSLLTVIMAYPGITERGRWRADFNLNVKYDLPYDFYITMGGALNYDNQPAADASETDYDFRIGFGWEW
jgi:hypothetical protein